MASDFQIFAIVMQGMLTDARGSGGMFKLNLEDWYPDISFWSTFLEQHWQDRQII